MRHSLGLLLLGTFVVACSQSGTSGSGDLGAAADVDQGAPWDQGTTDGAPGEPSLRVLAGTLGGSGNVDDTGTAARFDYPSRIASDGAGNLYITDTNNSTIRKIVVATGAVTTLAGSPGVYGSSDGTGSAARFGLPYSIAYDGSANLYVGDNNTIRKIVVATGAVTTLCGSAGMAGSTDGIGSVARFSLPQGIAADGAGSVYVADSNNHTIRKIVVATGTVTTLAGSPGASGTTDGTAGAARFNLPQGITADGAGNLYVADTNSHTIRKVVAATGAVTTLVGSPGASGSSDGVGSTARFDLPQGIAVDSAGDLYVMDTNSSTLRKVVVSTRTVTTLAGSAGVSGSSDGTGTAARFSRPQGVAVDRTDTAYVVDSDNHALRKVVLASGAVTTLAGRAATNGSSDGTGEAARFSQPQSIAGDTAGSLYVADTLNSTIRKIVVATGAVSTLAGSAGLTGSSNGNGTAARFFIPYGVAVDGAGNLYIADTSNHTIRKLVLATGDVSTIAGSPGLIGNSDGVGGNARFYFPYGLAVDGTGNLFVADRNNHAIRAVALATGAVTTLAGRAGVSGNSDGNGSAARFNGPQAVAVDSAGSVYVADSGNHTIRKIVAATGAVTTLAGSAGVSGSSDGTGTTARFNVPSGVAADGAGNLFISDSRNSTIRKLELTDNRVTTFIGSAGQRRVTPGPLPALFNRPSGLTVSPTGELFLLGEDAVLGVR